MTQPKTQKEAIKDRIRKLNKKLSNPRPGVHVLRPPIQAPRNIKGLLLLEKKLIRKLKQRGLYDDPRSVRPDKRTKIRKRKTCTGSTRLANPYKYKRRKKSSNRKSKCKS